jgi:hypothetical protein
VVKVMKTDGDFVEFEFPCIAAVVMLQHPAHIVVHCTKVDRSSIGQRTKIIIMLPDQPMLPGQPYMLYPIPESYKKSLARSKSFSMIKKKLESSGGTSTVTPAEKRQGRRKALKMMFTRLNLATYVASNIESPKTPLIEGDESSHRYTEENTEGEEIQEENGSKKPLTVQLPNPESLNFSWRPRLSMIPESPLGFHSNPGTPRGLYKLDSSPLAIGSRTPTFVAPV